MPKPMLGTRQKTETDYMLSLTAKTETKAGGDPLKIDKLLRKQRSKQYMETVSKLDVGGKIHNHGKAKEIIEALRQEFPEIELDGDFMGIVSKCHLGEDYEVHRLDIIDDIIEHYRRGQPLPDGLEKARSIAIHGGYEFIEVYTNCFRAIGRDGSVSVVY
ncbi:MAG: hypothetical protein FWG68_12865 [Defluviitaleaceae bacterium]|nr:hypothetical protein [Defluviitaleaceae bacterium]